MTARTDLPRLTVLDRYIVRSILGGVGLVVLVLLALGAVFLFMNQQDDIGVGSYSTIDALFFVLLNLPAQAWELLPISALIGSLLALGNLARDSELTVMRAAGLSVWRITRAAGIAAALLGLIAALLGELVGPPLQDLARQQKAFSKFANVSFTGSSGAWIRDGNLILNVERQTGDARFGGMMLYELGPDRRLAALGRAATASEDATGKWRLGSYVETRFDGDRAIANRLPSRALESNVSAEFLGIAARSPTQLPVVDLVRMVEHLESNELDARAPTFALWSRVARLFAVAFGVLLALPFVFGSLRAAGAGTRVALGFVVGIGLFILQRTLESGVVVFNAPPVLLAWIPTALMATLAVTLISRTR
ncbi:MAG: LPS export ABC transporter permease LptG [Steroidobacteraceae bacterium]